MKVSVIGGAGYLGSVLVRELIARGYQVQVIDRGLYGLQALEEVEDQIELLVKEQSQIEPYDFSNVSSVIYVGGLSNDPICNLFPEANRIMNSLDVAEIAQTAASEGVERFIFASSASVYDQGVFQDIETELDETAEVNPQAPYSAAKKSAEGLLLDVSDNFPDFHVTLMRMGTLYGLSPRMRFDLVVNTFVRHAVKNRKITAFYLGQMYRPLCSVQDAAKAYAKVLSADKDLVSGEVFNIVKDNYRISELALAVKNTLADLGVEIEVIGDPAYRPVRSYRISGDKAMEKLKFAPEKTVDSAVRDIYEAIESGEINNLDKLSQFNIKYMKNLVDAAKVLRQDFSLEPDDVMEVLR